MRAKAIGLLVGLAALGFAIFASPPAGLSREGFVVAGLVVLMAAWWITEALPLTATALMPFLVLPFAGVMDANETASAYYSPILFLLLGGAFIALAIERVGLHRRLSLGILRLAGAHAGPGRLLLAFMPGIELFASLHNLFFNGRIGSTLGCGNGIANSQKQQGRCQQTTLHYWCLHAFIHAGKLASRFRLYPTPPDGTGEREVETSCFTLPHLRSKTELLGAFLQWDRGMRKRI
mgnify:CR=1 FL=1